MIEVVGEPTTAISEALVGYCTCNGDKMQMASDLKIGWQLHVTGLCSRMRRLKTKRIVETE